MRWYNLLAKPVKRQPLADSGVRPEHWRLGFIFTMMLGYLVLGEPIGFQRVVGTMLIAAELF